MTIFNIYLWTFVHLVESVQALFLLFNLFSSHSFLSYYPGAYACCLLLLLYSISANRVSVCRFGQEPRLSAAPLGQKPVSTDTV